MGPQEGGVHEVNELYDCNKKEKKWKRNDKMKNDR